MSFTQAHHWRLPRSLWLASHPSCVNSSPEYGCLSRLQGHSGGSHLACHPPVSPSPLNFKLFQLKTPSVVPVVKAAFVHGCDFDICFLWILCLAAKKKTPPVNVLPLQTAVIATGRIFTYFSESCMNRS